MTGILLMKLFGSVVSVGLGAGILARDHGLKANRLIAAFLFCNAWWAGLEFFLYQTEDPATAETFYRLMTIGWLPLGVLCTHTSVTLSAMEEHPITRWIPWLYLGVLIVLPFSIGTGFVLTGAEKTSLGWRPHFGSGMLLAYLLLATPVFSMRSCWRTFQAMPGIGGQLQLARIVYFGVAAALVMGTLTAIVMPLLGIDVIGITTTLIALVGVAAAVTLRRFGHSLISPDAFAREVLDTLQDGIVLVSADGILRDANRAFLRMTGEHEQMAVGRSIARWIPEFVERAEQASEPTLMELRTRQGERFPVVVSSPVACRENGRLVGHAYLLRDRREILALQRQLVVSARLAAVGDLSKSISQSIRDPIARARDELEGLSVDWNTNELILELHRLTDECQEAVAEGHELIAECAEGVERIFSIVQEVGSFSEEGLQGDLDEHSLARIVERALRVARAQAPDWMRIEDRLDPNVLIRCRFGQIERVVTNLLVNAIHALQDNDRARANLVVAVGAQGDRALLHVEDDGCGIESEALDRIFDPFFTTKPVGKGTGLGLAISYHTVKAHGGAIRVSSVVGRGTSVTVELPRAPSPGRSLRTDASGARPHRTG